MKNPEPKNANYSKANIKTIKNCTKWKKMDSQIRSQKRKSLPVQRVIQKRESGLIGI